MKYFLKETCLNGKINSVPVETGSTSESVYAMEKL